MNDKIRALIVDDEPLARRGIRQLLQNERDFIVAGEAANGSEALSLLQELSPDMIFLDIQMPLIDGFSFIERITPDAMPEIVLVTAFDEHAIRAFEAGALDYVLKPVDPKRFHKTLERVRQRIAAGRKDAVEEKFNALLDVLKPKQNSYLRRLTIKSNGRIFLLETEKITWISSLGNYVEIYAGREKFILRETMDGIEQKLDPRDFLRIRRSKIVSIAQVKQLQPLFNGEFTLVLIDGTELQSSRRYRDRLASAFDI